MASLLRTSGSTVVVGIFLAASFATGVSANSTSTTHTPATLTDSGLGLGPTELLAVKARRATLRPPADSSPQVWAWMVEKNNGSPVRWNPCSTITWNWKEGKRRDVKVMRKAVRKLSRALGMRFQKTSRSPLVTIGYNKKPRAAGALAQGGFVYSGSGRDQEIVRGAIDIDKKLKKKKSQKRFPTSLRKELYMHEWGHVVGLDHVDSRNELMFPNLMGNLTDYGSGDKAGLRILGDDAGCSSS